MIPGREGRHLKCTIKPVAIKDTWSGGSRIFVCQLWSIVGSRLLASGENNFPVLLTCCAVGQRGLGSPDKALR